MRSDLSVGGKEVLAVVLNDVHLTNALSYSKGFGEKNISKDFLMPGYNKSTIKRGETAKKRKCAVVYLLNVDADVVEEIKVCMHDSVIILQYYYRVIFLYCSYQSQIHHQKNADRAGAGRWPQKRHYWTGAGGQTQQHQ